MNIQSVVIYDPSSTDNCNAILIVKQKLGDTVEYIQMQRNDIPSPEIYTGNNVYMIGISFSKNAMNAMILNMHRLFWCDNHESIVEDWTEGIYPAGKAVLLHNQRFAYVEKEDFAKIIKYTWYTHSNGSANAYIGLSSTGSSRLMSMHHMILPQKDGFVVDHINRNRIDNRRCNLRYATRGENSANSESKRLYKGIEIRGSKFRARILIDYKTIDLGTYYTAHEAAKAYDAAARKQWGAFARTNFDQQEPFPPTAHIILDRSQSCTTMAQDFFFPKKGTSVKIAAL